MLEEVVLEVVETSAILAASMARFSKSISRNTAGSKMLSSSNFRLEVMHCGTESEIVFLVFFYSNISHDTEYNDLRY